MKKLLIAFLIFIPLRLLAPAGQLQLHIMPGAKITELDLLIKAVVWVESKNDPFAFNPREGAVGAFQIRQCRVDHYNRLKGTSYKLEDFYDYDLSCEMFRYFAKGKTHEMAARSWNGSGPMTVSYWNKVKASLYRI